MTHSPRSLIVTVFGLYARAAGGTLPVAGLVRILAALDVDEQAVRAAISRLKRRGLLKPERIDGMAGYALTTTGSAVLAEGDARIFGPHQAKPSDGWVLCVFSIPESERAKRHVLRGKLTWLGFGQAAPGVWIAPAHGFDAVRAMLTRHDLQRYVSLFRADYFGAADAVSAVREWWDLPKLARMYQEFVDRHPVKSAEPDALPSWLRAVTDWRRLPYLDPGLPAELLPTDWPGHTATELFHRLRSRLSDPAAVEAGRLLG